jgi:hypothetical protein
MILTSWKGGRKMNDEKNITPFSENVVNSDNINKKNNIKVEKKRKNAKKWTREQRKKILAVRVSILAFRKIMLQNGFTEQQIKDEENVIKYILTKDNMKILITGNLLTYEIKVFFDFS